ncbi:MAG: hypothetical protein U1F71_21530 [Verrucomicrobiaceae bacterium]
MKSHLCGWVAGGQWVFPPGCSPHDQRSTQQPRSISQRPSALRVAWSPWQGEAQSARVAGVIVTQGQTGLHQLMQLLAGGIPFDFPSA